MSGNLASQPVSQHQNKIHQNKKLAEEEVYLINNLCQSLGDKNKRQRKENNGDNILDIFRIYVAKALSELDCRTCPMAQNNINSIICQAKGGLLTQTPEMVPQMIQSQPLQNFKF